MEGKTPHEKDQGRKDIVPPPKESNTSDQNEKTRDITSMKKSHHIVPLEDNNKILKDSKPKQEIIVEDNAGKDLSSNISLKEEK